MICSCCCPYELLSFSTQVPSLNTVPLHCIPPNSLVRYRCMIQDMFDPELYLAVYEAVNIKDKSKVCVCVCVCVLCVHMQVCVCVCGTYLSV